MHIAVEGGEVLMLDASDRDFRRRPDRDTGAFTLALGGHTDYPPTLPAAVISRLVSALTGVRVRASVCCI
jgi:hypothetical protein